MNAQDLNEKLKGKTIAEVIVINNAPQDCQVIFTDGTKWDIEVCGDDMSYVDYNLTPVYRWKYFEDYNGDGMHTVRLSHYKMMLDITGKPVGFKIPISQEEYNRNI